MMKKSFSKPTDIYNQIVSLRGIETLGGMRRIVYTYKFKNHFVDKTVKRKKNWYTDGEAQCLTDIYRLLKKYGGVIFIHKKGICEMQFDRTLPAAYQPYGLIGNLHNCYCLRYLRGYWDHLSRTSGKKITGTLLKTMPFEASIFFFEPVNFFNLKAPEYFPPTPEHMKPDIRG